MRKLTIVALSLFVLSACAERMPIPEEWAGFIFPRDGQLAYRHQTGVYKTLNSCIDYVKIQANVDQLDYMCGLNCVMKSNGNYKCDKTKGTKW